MIQMTMEEYERLGDGYGGLCLGCGAEQWGGVEPDAVRYTCESCGEHEVYGAEELLMMGLLEVVE